MQVLTPISWNNPPVGGRNDATDFSPNLELCRVFVATTLSHIYLQFMAFHSNIMRTDLTFHWDYDIAYIQICFFINYRFISEFNIPFF